LGLELADGKKQGRESLTPFQHHESNNGVTFQWLHASGASRFICMKTLNKSTAAKNNSEGKAKPSKSSISRRSFLGKSLAVGAGTVGAGFFINTRTARASSGLTPGDAALLRFPAALERLEADFWIQYNELGRQERVAVSHRATQPCSDFQRR